MPPLLSIRVLAASAISASLVPTTSRLWASWATVEAMAPQRIPKPLQKPKPTLPVSWWRSNTAVFNTSCSTSECTCPSDTVRSAVPAISATLPEPTSITCTFTRLPSASGAPSPVSGALSRKDSGVMEPPTCTESIAQAG